MAYEIMHKDVMRTQNVSLGVLCPQRCKAEALANSQESLIG